MMLLIGHVRHECSTYVVGCNHLEAGSLEIYKSCAFGPVPAERKRDNDKKRGRSVQNFNTEHTKHARA